MDKDIEDKWEQLQEKLEEVFGKDNAHIVGCVKGKTLSDLFESANKFMTRPILTIKCSRTGTNIEANKCSSDEIRNAVEASIAHMLEMFPKEWRNDILYNAIQQISDKHDEGTLFEEDDDNEDEDE